MFTSRSPSSVTLKTLARTYAHARHLDVLEGNARYYAIEDIHKGVSMQFHAQKRKSGHPTSSSPGPRKD